LKIFHIFHILFDPIIFNIFYLIFLDWQAKSHYEPIRKLVNSVIRRIN
jgi:hypothetical protein